MKQSRLGILLVVLIYVNLSTKVYSQSDELLIDTQSIDNEQIYCSIDELHSFHDRLPIMYKIQKLRIGRPNNYWVKVLFEEKLETKIDYIKYLSKAYGVKKSTKFRNNRVSRYDVYLNSQGTIDSIRSDLHEMKTVSEKRIIGLLKSCKWQPALSDLEPTAVKFILEIGFVNEKDLIHDLNFNLQRTLNLKLAEIKHFSENLDGSMLDTVKLNLIRSLKDSLAVQSVCEQLRIAGQEKIQLINQEYESKGNYKESIEKFESKHPSFCDYLTMETKRILKAKLRIEKE